MTEDLLLSLLLIFILRLQVVLNHLAVVQVKRVGHKHIHVLLQQSGLVILSLLLFLLIVQRHDAPRTLILQFLRRVVVLLRVAISLALALVRAQGLVVHGAQALIVLQALHLFLYTFNLVGGHTLLHQFHCNLLLCRTSLLFFHNKLNDLLVSQSRLCRDGHTSQKEHPQEEENFSHIYRSIF